MSDRCVVPSITPAHPTARIRGPGWSTPLVVASLIALLGFGLPPSPDPAQAASTTGIAFRSASSANNTVTSSLTLPVPAHAAGDVLIAVVDVTQSPTVTHPAGWTLVQSDSSPGGNHLKQVVYEHVVGAAEPASYRWAFSAAHQASGGIVAYSGVDGSHPIDATAGQAVAATQITAPSLVTSVPNAALIGVFGVGGSRSLTTPTGMTQRVSAALGSTAGEKITLEIADQPLAAAGPAGPRVADAGAASNGVGQLVALRPALPPSRPPTGTVVEYLLTSGSLPSGIASGPGGLWFTIEQNANLGRITTGGAVTLHPIPTPGNLGGITGGPDGNVWFTEFDGNRVARATPTGTIAEFPVPTPASGLAGIAAGGDGNLWFAETTANRIGRVTPAGQINEFSIPTASAFPHGIARGPDGNVWFAERNVGKIGRITPTGAVTEFRLPVSSSKPQVVTAGPDGNVWFTEVAGKIGRMTPAGALTEFPLPSASALPTGIAAGPDGNVWFAERGINKIGRITTAGTVSEYPVPTAAAAPDRISAGPDGNLWFTEHDAGKIGRISP